MITRGVASVRSPVKNLQEFNSSVTHDNFVGAVVQAFREEYHIEGPVRPTSQSHFHLLNLPLLLAQVRYVQAEDATGIPYVQDSITELPVSILTFPLWV